MIPDKIYIHRTIHLGLLSASEIDITGQDEQYIRKDAMLEWAKEKKKQLLENESANNEPSDVAAGINAGLDMVIGKLKSM